MIFFTLIIIAIGLYIWGYKTPALLIFFFLMTSGFNLIPEEFMENKLFSKGMDYAILTIVGMIIIDSFCIKNYLKPDKLLWLILIFYVFLAFCILYNRYVVGVSWKEIVRTARYNILWMAYLVFRNFSQEQLLKLLKYLFFVTVVCSALFLLQIILDEHILNETVRYEIYLLGMKIPRYYNQPDMLPIFAFMAIYFNPCKGPMKIVTAAILICALLGAFHRSLFFAFILSISAGYIIRLPRVKRGVVLISTAVLCLFFIVFFGYKFANSRTVKDVSVVTSGNVGAIDVKDIDIEELQKSTFTFRIAHFIERNQYLLDHPKAMLFGAGLMTEDSKITGSMFDFDIGLIEELSGKTAQLDTPDISYSILIMRYGYLGTLLVFSMFVYFMIYFYKNRKDSVGVFSFAYLVTTIFVSFFSYTLTQPISFLMPLITYNLIQKNIDNNELKN